jgi:hypothetical protein
MRGAKELDEDLRQVCAQKHYGKQAKSLDYRVPRGCVVER